MESATLVQVWFVHSGLAAGYRHVNGRDECRGCDRFLSKQAITTKVRRSSYMEFKDKVLTCRDCGAEFVFTAGEQEFYAEKGFQHEPVRCRDCRMARKRQRNDGPREMYTVTCSACGKEAEVPFRPREDRPVYCRECFEAQKSSWGA